MSFSSPFYSTVSFSGWSWVLDNQRLAQLQLQPDLQWRGDPGCGECSKWGLALICHPSVFVLCLAGTMWTDDLKERECAAVFRGSHLGTIAFAYAHCSCGIVLANLTYTFFLSKYTHDFIISSRWHSVLYVMLDWTDASYWLFGWSDETWWCSLFL